MRDKIVDVMPEMKTGKELLDCLRETPEYPACIWEKAAWSGWWHCQTSITFISPPGCL